MRKPENHEMENVIGVFLRTGVILSAALVLIGGAVYLYRHGLATVNYGMFRPRPAGSWSIQEIAGRLLSFHGSAFIQLGLWLLIATPVARVFYSIFAFARQKDFTYVVVTMMVFGILAFSLFSR